VLQKDKEFDGEKEHESDVEETIEEQEKQEEGDHKEELDDLKDEGIYFHNLTAGIFLGNDSSNQLTQIRVLFIIYIALSKLDCFKSMSTYFMWSSFCIPYPTPLAGRLIVFQVYTF